MIGRGVIHLGNAGTGRMECGARERKEYRFHCWEKNWSFSEGNVTCKRCLAVRERRRKELEREWPEDDPPILPPTPHRPVRRVHVNVKYDARGKH